MVSGHLAAVERILAPHAFLDEGMAALVHDGNASGLLHHLDGVPYQAWIMHNAPPGMILQSLLCQQSHQVVAFDEGAVLVEEEAAVAVPIPGQAEISFFLDHRVCRNGAVFGK